MLREFFKEFRNRLKAEGIEHDFLGFHEGHLEKIMENITGFFEDESFIDKINYPVFSEEIMVNRKAVFENFSFLNREMDKETAITKLRSIQLEDYLVVLGQRRTPATVKDKSGIPPLNDEVLAKSFQPFNIQISKAVRAFEKHSERYADCFWGEVKGTPSEKVEKVKKILYELLHNKTWWNVFGHFQHDLVYEVRVPSGHGARWKKENLEFIGFVEPFDKVEK